MSDDRPADVWPNLRRRAEDRDEVRARAKAWEQFQALGSRATLFEAFHGGLDVYRSELATNAVRRIGGITRC